MYVSVYLDKLANRRVLRILKSDISALSQILMAIYEVVIIFYIHLYIYTYKNM